MSPDADDGSGHSSEIDRVESDVCKAVGVIDHVDLAAVEHVVAVVAGRSPSPKCHNAHLVAIIIGSVVAPNARGAGVSNAVRHVGITASLGGALA